MMTLKISLGIFFGRLVVKSWQIGLIYANVGLNIFSSAASFFYCLFRCGANLDNYVAQQLYNRCTPRTLDRFMAYQQAAITTLTDVIFVLLPIFILWNANMSRRSKISVGLILCLAALYVRPLPPFTSPLTPCKRRNLLNPTLPLRRRPHASARFLLGSHQHLHLVDD
jgi:hypothetical protein